MLKYTIDRKTWRRGKGIEGSHLRTDKGMKCCLGFDANACGFKDEDITGFAEPDTIGARFGDNQLPGLIIWDTCGESYTSDIAGFMMDVNDRPIGTSVFTRQYGDSVPREIPRNASGVTTIDSEATREAILTLCFRSIGREVTFK